MPSIDNIKSNLMSLGFTNTSAVSLFNKIAESLGLVIDTNIAEFENTKLEIVKIITTQRYGKEGYYNLVATSFQIGDNLSIDSLFNYYYPVKNVVNQIIKQSAFVSIGQLLFIKIASVDLLGNTVPLTSTQLDSFKSYFLNFEIPGIPVTIISNSANILDFYSVLSYFKTYDLSVLKNNLFLALTTFRQSFAFNGVFYVTDLQKYIEDNVPGVRSFYLLNTLIDSAPFAGNIILDSGYFNYVANIIDKISYSAI